MSDYRKEVKSGMTEVRWTAWKVLPTFVAIILILSAIGFGTRSLGLWGSTVVERKVFENSYQRSEALKSQIAVDEAVLAEIKAKLTNPNLDANTRINLEAQMSAINVRLRTTRSKQ